MGPIHLFYIGVSLLFLFIILVAVFVPPAWAKDATVKMPHVRPIGLDDELAIEAVRRKENWDGISIGA